MSLFRWGGRKLLETLQEIFAVVGRQTSLDRKNGTSLFGRNVANVLDASGINVDTHHLAYRGKSRLRLQTVEFRIELLRVTRHLLELELMANKLGNVQMVNGPDDSRRRRGQPSLSTRSLSLRPHDKEYVSVHKEISSVLLDLAACDEPGQSTTTPVLLQLL